jgi:ABC-type transport system substrate-binding protein
MAIELSPGTVVAGFCVESLVGRGAMAEVYRAREQAGGRIVALKLLDNLLAHDERFRQRFLRESELATGLDHPHIVPTLASGEDGGRLYLALELIDGSDLRDLLRRGGRLEPERAVELVEQVADALDAAHKVGLVHRDVKPGNILVRSEEGHDHAYVCDFGLARHVSSVSSLTGDRGFVGTIDYVPPEQIEGGSVDARADVYSLGCVLYECLAGVRPFDRDSELSVVFAHLNEPPPKLTDVRPDLPAAFDEVFATALAKNPDERYSSCGELAAAARAALHGEVLARRRPRRRLIAAAVATLLLAAGATTGVLLASRGGSGHKPTAAAGPPPIPLHANSLNLVDLAGNRVVGHIGLGKAAAGSSAGFDVVPGGRSAWVLVVANQKLLRVDLRARRVTRTVALPWVPAGRIAVGGGFVWVTQDGGPGILGVAAGTGRIVRRFKIDAPNGVGVAYGNGSLWLAEGDRLARVDPRTGRVLNRIVERPGQSGQTEWLTFADGWLWAGSADNGVVRKVDPVANRIVAKATVPGRISDIAVDHDVWVTVSPDDLLDQFNEDDLRLERSVPSGRDPERISTGGGRVWIANAAGDAVSSVVQSTLARSQRAATARPQTAVYGGRFLLAAATPLPAPLPPIKGAEVRVSTPTQVLFPDPAAPRTPQDREVEYATCANLLVYPDSAGREGGTLRPEVAAAMPGISPDGRTYTFRIRPGFRFSPPSNQPVTADTFRYTIERALSPSFRGFGDSTISDIVGLPAFQAGRARHVTGIVARGNTLRITLNAPNGAFPELISEPYFCPVPVGTPIRPVAVTGRIPRDGPYYVASISSDRTVLLRNPNYGGTRPRMPARIVYSTGTPTSEAVSLVDHGDLDYLPDNGNAGALVSLGGLLDRRYGPGSAAARRGDQRYLHRLTPAWDAVVLNASQPLFRSPRMRRAVEYALDRVALARGFGDIPGESIVPPAVVGFGRTTVYPLGGDLATARLLAGGGRHRATLYYCTNGVFGGSGQDEPAVMIRRQLARIGIAVSITSPPCGGDNRYDANSRRADLVLASDYNPVLDPEGFIHTVVSTTFLGAALGRGLWTDPRFLARMRHAHTLGGTARIAAFRRIEDDLLRAAPIAVYGTWIGTLGYFSPRVGCRIIPPGVGVIDLAALCKHSA